jgi:tRNA 5-methylaminomethyl-2-thiouridine biosynthesis bifunctional protein
MQRVGFTVEKQPGFAGKREMLKGTLLTAKEKIREGTLQVEPWLITPHRAPAEQRAVIIGGGLAGTAAAYSLARRGWQVTLIERHDTLAQEASGNPSGILMPLIAAPDDVVGQFFLEAYRYAVQHMNQLPDFTWQQCGTLQLMTKDANRVRYKNAPDHPALSAGVMQPVSASDASALAGIKLSQGGWFFPQGGYVSPPALCKAQIAAFPDCIKVLYHAEAISLTYINEWNVLDKKGEKLAEAPVVIIANALDATHFQQCSELPLRRVRGQVSYLPATKASQKLQTVLCYEGYMTPAVGGVHSVGATFHPDETHEELRASDHEENIAMLKPYISEGLLNHSDVEGRVAFRAASPDRRPLVGEVPDIIQFQKDYADLVHGKQYKTYPAGNYFPGLYVSLGHGSRGITSTPIAAELLACKITGEALPLEQSLADALNPARFVIRSLKSGQA